MKIALGRRGDYAVRAVLYLARHQEGRQRWKAHAISGAMDVPGKYLPQVLADLVRHGIVESLPGPSGGYRLTRPPSEVSLLAVVEAAEGTMESTECVLRGGPCHWEDRCAVHESWARARQHFAEELAAVTFADLAAEDELLGGGAG